jgi:Uma2 family endonuclease
MILLTGFSLNSSPLVKRYTLEELNQLPEPEDHSKLELIDGVLYMSPLPLAEHSDAIEKIDSYLRNQIFSGYLRGKIYRPRAGIRTGKNTWLEPDLFFLNEETAIRFSNTIPTTADLVIEVLSPSTEEYDRKTKADTYSALSVRELWLVDLVGKTIEVRENPNANKSWERYVLYTWGEVIQSPVLGISVDTGFLGAR